MTPTPLGLCQCGCGQATKAHPDTNLKQGRVRGVPRRFVYGHHLGAGPLHPGWKGGRGMHGNGYVDVFAPGHPRAHRKNGQRSGYVFEHILVAENALGRTLPATAVVHHVNGQKDDNHTPFNLVICEDQGYHMLLHKRQRAMDACGDPNAWLCGYCKRYDRQDDITVSTRGGGCLRAYHRSCAREKAARNAATKKAQKEAFAS